MDDPARGRAAGRLQLERALAIALAEKLASRVMVLEGELRQLSRASGRHVCHLVRERRRVEYLEGILAAGLFRPARLAAALVQLERLVSHLARRRCPSCRILAGAGHRERCRVEAALRRAWIARRE